MPITQRTEALVTPTVALFSQGKSQLHGLELAYAYIAAAALVDSPFPLEWTILLLVLVRKLILLLRYNEGETKTPFVILILVHYEGWTDNQDGGRSMQLNAVKEDMKLLLDTLRYRHGDTTRMWYILSDFEYVYKDETGKERPLARWGPPTRERILRTVEEATKSGGSGLIHYGGHCHYAVPGTSSIEKQGTSTRYTETKEPQGGGKAAYLICSDGRRIYGNEFFASLRAYPSNASTITVVLDTCEAEGLIADLLDLSNKYNAHGIPIVKLTPSSRDELVHQLIVVTACRLRENAYTANDCGALTFFLMEYFQRFGNPSAKDLVRYLDDQFANQPKECRQHPQIQSRYPLHGPFRLLPVNSRFEA